MNFVRSSILFTILILILFSCHNRTTTILIKADYKNSLINFAVTEIRSALSKRYINCKIDLKKDNADIIFKITRDTKKINSEGFSITKNNSKIIITALDTAGAMYGGLNLAEQINIYGLAGVKETRKNPYMKMRGTKFNIPLDARTPSYSDASDAAQNNIEEMWNLNFWKEYIDNIARYRYNFISFWSLHPFPSLVKVPDYPDIALNDVHKTKNEWDEYYSLNALGYDAPEILKNYTVLKEMTIEDKIEYWLEVMRYAKSRNVDIYIITWNVFVNGTEGKYGITTDINNKTTKDYFKKSIIEMFRTYPDLAGIGLTTGENMKGISFKEKENWAFDTYGQGILEAAKEMPDRKFMLIHRQHQADPEYIEYKFSPVIEQPNVEFIYSFKYAKAHVFSATEQPYHDEFVENIGSLKTIWTLRNDDSYYFRWGSPEFVREFIKNIPYEVSKGIYYGSDQWVWGREFTTKNVTGERQLEIVKHWYHWLSWGRLSYDPKLDNDRFIELIRLRFPDSEAKKLYTAWHEASMVYPVTTGFHWGRVDFLWYIEGCRSRPKNAKNEHGFHDVNTFIFYPVHPKSGNITIPEFVELVKNNEKTNKYTPIDVSNKLHSHSDKALSIINSLNEDGGSEYKSTINDIRTVAYMGKYYAHKISGSANVALYRETKNKSYQENAISELTTAAEFWEKFMNSALRENINPILTNRVGIVDWKKSYEWVKQDIEIAKAEK